MTEQEQRDVAAALEFQKQMNIQASALMAEAWIRTVLLMQNGQLWDGFRVTINRYASQLAGITEDHRADQT